MMQYTIGMSILGILTAFGLIFSASSIWPSGVLGGPKNVDGIIRLLRLVMGLCLLLGSYALAVHMSV